VVAGAPFWPPWAPALLGTKASSSNDAGFNQALLHFAALAAAAAASKDVPRAGARHLRIRNG